ncbi:MAG: hypothetical protein D6694_12130 [Gammaproteobacteria bacterium]|nr:MAG: hypothetical protein D6694_12130 [Gammaproteobacteria bacterium]
MLSSESLAIATQFVQFGGSLDIIGSCRELGRIREAENAVASLIRLQLRGGVMRKLIRVSTERDGNVASTGVLNLKRHEVRVKYPSSALLLQACVRKKAISEIHQLKRRLLQFRNLLQFVLKSCGHRLRSAKL